VLDREARKLRREMVAKDQEKARLRDRRARFREEMLAISRRLREGHFVSRQGYLGFEGPSAAAKRKQRWVQTRLAEAVALSKSALTAVS
jgi:hypothetical protein